MELKDFIKTSLRELSEAIDESGVELHKSISLTNTSLRLRQMGNYGLIDFDLALQVQESEKNSKGGGVKISVIEAKVGKDADNMSNTTSRIKFTIEANFNSSDAQKRDELKPRAPQIG